MAHWHPIVGKSFLPSEFDEYVDSFDLTDWRPEFVVLHNTASPTLAEWRRIDGVERMRNLQSYYSGLGWSAGPHLFVADDLVWAFTPLDVPGVHSPSWNRRSWGVEMVGNYEAEAFDRGRGALVKANTIGVLAALHRKLGIAPNTLRLHREDPKTHHACPGRFVRKAEIVAALERLLHPLH